jgi:membrane peptidoglycan carboxypeptidase
VRYRAPDETDRAFPKDVVADVDYALQQVVRNGTGTEARALGRPAAGKTGTAALRPDTTTSAWFVGFTPQLSAAVDFYKGTGRADLDGVGGLSTFFGGAYPARIWTAFMTAALKTTKVEEFPPPAYVGEAVNPEPTFTPTPSETPTETPSETATPTDTGQPTESGTPAPPSTPPGQSSPPASSPVVISPGTG